MRRDDLRPGLRVLGFERRVVIALRVGDGAATILRILYGGRDLGPAFFVPEGSGCSATQPARRHATTATSRRFSNGRPGNGS